MEFSGVAPFTYSYVMTITSPSAYPTGLKTVLAVDVAVLSAPAGVSATQARSFITVAPDPVEFNGPNETQQLTVTFVVPDGTPDGTFQYHLTTPGWPTGYGIQDDGTSISASVTPPFTFPSVTLQIDSPANGARYTHTVGQPAVQVPISVTGTCDSSNPVDQVTVTVTGVDGTGASLAIPAITWNYSGAGTPQEVVTAQLGATLPGTYTISASARDHLGGTATATATFVVDQVTPPPTIAITQAPDASYDYYLGSAALQIPFAFRAVSAEGGITSLAATLNGTPVTVVPSGLGTLIATGSGTLSVAAGGDYELVVSAADAHGPATANATFHVNALVPATQPVSGTVFFDVNANGTRQPTEFGLPGFAVTLTSATGQTTNTTTSADGTYTFNLQPGTYRVAVAAQRGFTFTTAGTFTVSVAMQPVPVPDCGLGLSFADLCRMKADGCTIGFWKTNLTKAIAGRTCGTQVSAAKLKAYTTDIADLGLAPFDGLTFKQAVAVLGSCSSAAKDLLAKQLLASEYNYENGAYIGGNAMLTYAFVYWGESVLANPSAFSRSYLLYVADWCEAYNSSHGGLVQGPRSPSGGCGDDHDGHGGCDHHGSGNCGDHDEHHGDGGHDHGGDGHDDHHGCSGGKGH